MYNDKKLTCKKLINKLIIIRRNSVKKTILILTLTLAASYTALADVITDDSAKEGLKEYNLRQDINKFLKMKL